MGTDTLITLLYRCNKKPRASPVFGLLSVFARVKQQAPSSTSLLPLSIQWGWQRLDLFYWGRLLPLIELPLNFLF